ncbi:MAG: hypothetical protein EZS28_003408 [Streblomastix strix]|uniref:Uncharacterized protein n=1 Tax=Streblomastix strix TaxID=222440 RepID=A0A5J4X3K4_9EUKA|nr:MAG: hypothetical protein EZS28_003408 [Streblomastix strix]
MLMQVWKHQQEEKQPEIPPWRSQTSEQQQQLGGKLMGCITAWETINCKDFIQKGFYLFFKIITIERDFNKQSHNLPSKGIKQKCKHPKRSYKSNYRKKQQKKFRKVKLNGGTQLFWFLNLRENGERYQLQIFWTKKYNHYISK